MQKKTQNRELRKVFDFLKIALRTVLVFLVFHINWIRLKLEKTDKRS
jgi:hypothetical protein